ncbi:centromere protein F [Arapaima gigas]
MSWAIEEWKDGLPGRALQKIQEIEGQLDKLKKERQQKQFQMESLEAALQKQKQKCDMEKNEAAVLKRENQSLVESCENLERNKQKVSHELQVKDQQLNFLEGQLSSSKKQIEKLELEIKRYKNELDRNQSCQALDPQISSTPQKTFAMPATPSLRQSDSKFEELQEKYIKEVEDRKRLESELKVTQVRLLNQSSMSHKDIARQQTQSSIFPWQQEQNSSCHTSYTETPLKRKTGTSSFLWDPDDTPLKQNSRNSSASLSESGNSQTTEFLRATNQDLKAKVSELELRLQSQDKEMKNQMNKFQELQSQLDKAKKELSEKDRTLGKSRDELSKLSGQYDQAVTKCSLLEQKLKQLTEETNCQRHNAESLRRALEQKIKDQEKENQKELSRQKNAQVALEQQLNQVKMKMSQELQQAKKDNTLLQSDIDKVVTAQKNHLERNLEEVKLKLCRSEQALQASQAKELNWQKTSEEMKKENNSLSFQLEQGKKKLFETEEELKTVRQNLKQNNNLMEDLKIKTQAQSDELKAFEMKLESQSKSSAQNLENLKKTVADLEMKKGDSEKEVHKQRNELEQMTNKNTFLEKECHDLNLNLSSKLNECAELKRQAECLTEWKNEKENLINNIETERNVMLNRISDLEKEISTLNDTHNCVNGKMSDLENEKRMLMDQVDGLKGELLNKCMELEEKDHICHELQKKCEEAEQKYGKDLENTVFKVNLLQEQVTELEVRLQQEKSRVETMELSHSELLARYESALDLAKSKDSVVDLNQKEISHLQETLAQALAEQEQQLARFSEEKSSLKEKYEKSVFEKNAEIEQVKLNFEKSQLDLQSLNDAIASLDSALKLQEHLSTELQIKYDSLSGENDDLKEKISRAEKSEERLLHEISVLSEQTKVSSSLQEQFNTLSAAEEESKCALQKVSETLNQKVIELQLLSDNAEKLKQNLLEAEAKVRSLETENLQVVEKLKLLEQNIETLSSKNKSLQESNDALCEEKVTLLREKEVTSDITLALERELEASKQGCAKLTTSVEAFQSKYSSVVELNSKLESSLNDKSNKMSLYEEEMKTVADKHRVELERHFSEIKEHDEKYKALVEDLNATKLELQNKSDEVLKMKVELENSESEISSLRTQIATANGELVQINDSYKTVCQEKEFWMEKAASQQNEFESLKGVLSTLENATCEKESTVQSLKAKLRTAELDHIKAVDALKEKDLTMSKIKVQVEMLQMDLEDNEVYVNSFHSKIEALQSTVNKLEAKLQESDLQRAAKDSELSSLREELALKTTEFSQTKLGLEDASKQMETLGTLALEIESLQTEKSKLLNTVEEKVQKYSNLEKMFGEVTEKNSELQAKVEELENQCCTIQEENEGLKLENVGLKELLHIQKEEKGSLRSTFGETAEHNNKTDTKKKEFEKEQIELHQQFSLKSEHSALKDQYSSLLSQVTEQQSFIEQLQSEASCVTSSFENISLTNEEDCSEFEPAYAHKVDVMHSSVIIDELGTEPSPLLSGIDTGLSPGARAFDFDNETVPRSPLSGPLDCDKQSHVGHISGAFSLRDELQQKSEELELLSRSFDEAIRSFDGQIEAQQQISKTEISEMKGSLCVVQKDLKQLQKQHSTEVQMLKQELMNLSLEMEAKLAAERQHAEVLSAELEAARLQMQGLDLSSCPLFATESVESPLQLPAKVGDSVICQDTEDHQKPVEVGEAPGREENQAVTTIYNSQANPEQKFEDMKHNEETVQKLQVELQALNTQLELCTEEIASRTVSCTELEVNLNKLEEEKLNIFNKLSSVTEEKQNLGHQVEKLETEVSSLKMQLETSRCQLADVTEMLESIEVSKGDWNERVLQIESDLKRVQSEKTNLEKHILSMEADIEEMQKEKQKLEEDLNASRKANASLEQNLNIVTSEGVQLKQELLSYAEEKAQADQSLLKWKEKAERLEKDNGDTKELNKMLEGDLRNQQRKFEVTHSDIDNLKTEKQQLLSQLEVLEQTISLLSGEKEDLQKELNQIKAEQCKASRDSETAAFRVQSLEAEKVRLSRSLESSLLEKGEIVSRLNSTQEEVTHMKEGIEKLRVRIEADEKKRHHMGELLKETQRKADALQDRLEMVEREKEMTEQNLEDAVLQAETAKAEFEDLEVVKMNLAKQLEQVTTEKNNICDEKERLEKELAEKAEQLQRMEREVDVAVKSNMVAKELQSKLNTVVGRLQTCQRELESAQLKEQDVTCQLSALETENEHLSHQLQELQKFGSDMESKNQLLSEDLNTKSHELSKRVEENEQLKQQVTELQLLKEQKLALLKSEKEELQNEKLHLQATMTDREQKVQMVSAKCEVLQITITSLEAEVQQKEDYLQSARSLNTELAEKINVLNESNMRLQTDIKEALKSAEADREGLEKERLTLAALQQSSQQESESYKLALERLMSEKEELKRSLESSKESLAHEVKEREMVKQDLLKQSQQATEVQALKKEIATVEEKASEYLVEISSLKSSTEQLNSTLKEKENKLTQFEKLKVDELMAKVAQLSKEKDSVVGKMNLWMKSCKDLEKEKLSLLEQIEQQGALVVNFQTSQKQGRVHSNTEELRKEIEELKEALEEKSKEADESMDKYCSLLVTLHKLEETNETLQNQVSHLTCQVTASKGRRSTSKALQRSLVTASNENEAVRKDEGLSRTSGKRQRSVGPDGEDTPTKVQETLHDVAKKIRAGATPQLTRQLPARNEDDEEFRPEGLPDLVKKGFADIPVGENSPFILRRTTGRRCSPRLAAKKSPLSQHAPALENSGHSCLSPAEGRKQQTMQATHSFESKCTPGNMASVTNNLKVQEFESPKANMEDRKGRRSLSIKKTPEQREKRRQNLASAAQDDNCQVQ